MDAGKCLGAFDDKRLPHVDFGGVPSQHQLPARLTAA